MFRIQEVGHLLNHAVQVKARIDIVVAVRQVESNEVMTHMSSTASWLPDYNPTQKKIDNKTMKIPGVNFSWKRAVGMTTVKREISRRTGIPTSKAGIERKLGNILIKTLLGK